jgi:hypothetical protein
MKDFKDMEYNDKQEALVNILVQKTGRKNRLFFRLLVSFYFAQVAATMRCKVVSLDRGTIPVNFYCVNAAPSGFGKNFSMNILMDGIISGFREVFMEETFPELSEARLTEIAQRRVVHEDLDLEDALAKVTKEFDSLGELLFSFDSGTIPALKQLRQKLIMSKCGALNLIADEIGSNLLELSDILKAFLELYDKGAIGDKLLKSTSDNKRMKMYQGVTPANMMLFGTPLKLFDGGVIETTFMALMTTGFARRCFFGMTDLENVKEQKTADEIFLELTDVTTNNTLRDLGKHFKTLASIDNYNIELTMSKENSIALIEFKLDCERRADLLPKSDLDKRAELEHSYFKVLKLAASYAFIDGDMSVKKKHLESAMKLADDSSKVFRDKFMEREQPHVRLLNYLKEQKTPVTHADIMNALGFYPRTAAQRREMLLLAASHGYKENTVIQSTTENDIELFQGFALQETDTKNCILSYSENITRGYLNENVDFGDIHMLMQMDGYHWINHHVKDGYRDEDHVIKGTNLIVLDIDSGADITVAEMLLQEYKFYIYTTKRHEDDAHRYRIVMPISHVLNMDTTTYKLFMRNIYEWLPIKLDDQTGQRARKWLTQSGKSIYNDGKLLDARKFIPRTPKAVKLNQVNLDLQSLPQLEKWFMREIEDGTRNNTLVRYAFMLVDMGLDHNEILQKVSEMNTRLDNPLPDAEIYSTINVTIAKKLASKE